MSRPNLLCTLALLLPVAPARAQHQEPPKAAAEQAVEPVAEQPAERVLEHDVAALVAACNRFAAALHREIARDGPPTCSPASIAIALHMLLPGARGETAEQIARVLELPAELTGDRLQAAMEELHAKLRFEGEEPHLRVTNDLWVQRGEELLERYVDDVRQAFGAAPHAVDFAGATEAARRAINAHVAEATNDRIPELLTAEQLDASTRVVLTNAMWFKDAWLHPFGERATEDRPFTLASGERVEVPTMRVLDLFDFAETDTWRCVVLPFASGRMQFELFVPAGDGALRDAEAALLGGAHLPVLENRSAQVRLPRFRTSSRFELQGALQRLGMTAAFGPGADLSGMTGRRDLVVSQVVHEAWIDVDERGAEAAAATAVVIKRTAMPRAEVVFDADRPFAFGLRDRETGLLWFVGRVDDPRAAP